MFQMQHKRKFSVFSIFAVIMFLGVNVFGQANTWTGAVDLNWNTAGNWSNGVPTATSDVIINTSAVIQINSNTTINSLSIGNNSTVTFKANGGARTINMDNNGSSIALGSTLRLEGTTGPGNRRMEIGYTGANRTMTIAGTLLLTDVDEGSRYDAGGSITTVTGIIRNDDSFAGTVSGTIISSAANLIFSSGGTYQHALDGGSIPTANWTTGSNCEVTGIRGNEPNGLNQPLSNLTWNCTAQTADFGIEYSGTYSGNFIINSTGTSGSIRLADGNQNRALTVAGNFSLTGGEFRVDNGNGGSTLNVGGNFTLSGATQNFIICSGSGTSTVNVTGNVIVSGGVSPDGFEMSEDNGIGVLNVTGNFSHTGGLITETAGGSGSIIFNGTGTQIFTSGGTVANNINYTVNPGSTLQMNDATTVVNGASFTLSGTGAGGTLGIRSADGITLAPTTAGNIRTTTRSYAAAANYLYNGSAAQITGSGFPTNLTGDLIINNPGFTVTLDAEGLAADPRTIAAGGLVNLTAGTFAAGANLTLALGSEITRSEGTMTASVLGGTALDQYSLTYTGGSKTTGPEFLGGQGVPVRVNNVTLNLTAGERLSMATGLPIPGLGISGSAMNGVLQLTSGIINTTLSSGLLLTDAATVLGASAARYVNGPLAKTGIASFIFPVGNDSLYMPVAVSGSTTFGSVLPSSSIFIAQPFLGNPKVDPLAAAGSAVTAPLLGVSSCNWWDIDRFSGTGDVYVWLSIDNINECGATGTANTNLRVAHWEGAPGSWVDKGQSAITTVGGSNFLGAATGLATFSPFTIGDVSGTLPVELSKFSAAKNGSVVKLSWTTASEQNNAYFKVERSADGVSFSAIGKVNGAINSSAALNYSFNDNSPLAGKNFYRLRQVDLDGQFALSAIVSVNMSVKSKVSLYPNPVSNTALLQYPKAVKGAAYRVVAMDGRIMKSGILQENSTQMNLNLSGMQSGTYVLIINNNGEQYQQRIQKQ